MYQLYTVRAVGTQYHKIGITDNIQRRIRDLQTGSPHDLRVSEIIEFPDEETARKAEGFIHRTLTLAGMHKRGEWFDMSGGDRNSEACKRDAILPMVANGESDTAIIKEVWGISGGRNRASAKQELDQIVSELTQEGLL